jgi:hypothetical protein
MELVISYRVVTVKYSGKIFQILTVRNSSIFLFLESASCVLLPSYFVGCFLSLHVYFCLCFPFLSSLLSSFIFLSCCPSSFYISYVILCGCSVHLLRHLSHIKIAQFLSNGLIPPLNQQSSSLPLSQGSGVDLWIIG